MVCKYFSHPIGCLFILLIFFCFCAEAFKSDVVPSVDFCFCFLCFGYHIQKIFANAKFKELLFRFVLGVLGLTFKSF